MPWYRKIRNVFRADHLSHELDDELQFHLAETLDRLTAEGMSHKEAQRHARLLLGNYTMQKERTRDMNIAGWLEAACADFTYGMRQLKLNPGFAAVAILSLALGIGANTAIFQLLDAIRLRGLPVQNPSQLVTVNRANRDYFIGGWYASREEAFTYAQMQSLKARQTAFSDMLTFNPTRYNLSTTGRSRYAETLLVSSNFLSVLGVKPLLGVGFAPSNDKVACSATPVIISYNFWQREFGGGLNALGKTVSLDGHRFPVGAITPPSFFGLEPGQSFDVALPLCADAVLSSDGKGRPSNNIAYWLTAIARLKPGWTLERASVQIRDLSPAIFRETLPAEYRPEQAKQYLKNQWKVTSASAGVSSLRRAYEDPLWVLMAITGSVLLIACANLANLLLARATAREREMAVRQAVGAWRARLVQQLLSESLLVAFVGAFLGFALAMALSRVLVAFLTRTGDPLAVPLGVDWHVFGFLCLLAVGTCILFGLLPAIRASGASPASAMRGSRTTTASRERNGLRRTLVIAQVALSLVLLVAALLFTTNLRKLLATNIGFDSHNVLVADVSANATEFASPERRRELFRQIEVRLRSIPGVRSATSALFTPFSGDSWNGNVHGDSDSDRSGGKEAWFNRVGPNYLATMGMPLLAGREFTTQDDLNAPQVAIINQSFVKRFFAGRSALGRTFRVEDGAGKPDKVYQVVGIMGDTKYDQFAETQRSIAFLSLGQDDQPNTDRNFVLRSQGPILALPLAVEHQLSALNPNLLVDFRVLDVQIQESVLRERLMANLSAAFGFLAACLSALGLYGVTSYMVARRRNEIGVRIALGASRSSVYALVAKDVFIMLSVGLFIGAAACLLLGRYAESLLYNLKATDFSTLLMAASLLVVTTAFATVLPARRAAQSDPLCALRQE